MTFTLFVNIVASLYLAFSRIMGVKHKSFQAVAHLIVGAYFGIWFVDHTQMNYLWLASTLSCVELACFLVMKNPTPTNPMEKDDDHSFIKRNDS